MNFGEPSGPLGKWSYIELYLTIWGEPKNIFSYFPPYEPNGRCFRTFWRLLEPKKLQGNLKSYQGHWGNGVVLSCTSLFEVNQKPFSTIFYLLNLMEEVLELFKYFYSPKIFRGFQRAIRALLKKALHLVIFHCLVNMERHF